MVTRHDGHGLELPRRRACPTRHWVFSAPARTERPNRAAPLGIRHRHLTAEDNSSMRLFLWAIGLMLLGLAVALFFWCIWYALFRSPPPCPVLHHCKQVLSSLASH
jgi:hypothetical protein